MTTDAQSEISNPPSLSGTPEERRARRIAQLYASDSQFQAANPLPEVIDAARRPGLRLPEVFEAAASGADVDRVCGAARSRKGGKFTFWPSRGGHSQQDQSHDDRKRGEAGRGGSS
jgi:hypothetical protein